MNADRVTYLDSSAIVKLVVREPESQAVRRLVRRSVVAASALVRTEVVRSARLALGDDAVHLANAVLQRLDLVRVNDRILRAAGLLEPLTVRSLDAIHLATAASLGVSLHRVCTYDSRMAAAAEALGMTVMAPA